MLSLYIRFTLVPSTKATFVAHLADLMKSMAKEPGFVSAVLSEDPAAADELVLFELWNGSRDDWLSKQPHKPYRAAYDNATTSFVLEKEVHFLNPVALQS
ncbi:antibiotic biosynthesis monooxygenase family protein [Paraburkholderia youngii]|uniref:antibiotic biosynthesis monooxygenase family protein n=1 Tax=Paraburkholderia youngii TaxID=2782701 RepID=UPI003D25DE03